LSIKLGNTAINKLYLGDTQVNRAYLGDTLVFGGSTALYDNVSAMYSLRQPEMSNLWTNAVISLYNGTEFRFIFFDTNGEISLNSKTSSESATIPSEISLGTWADGLDTFITSWVAITPDNIFDASKAVDGGIESSRPKFMNSGVIITKNANSVIDFLSSSRYLLNTGGNSDLDSGKTFTIFTVSFSNSTADPQIVLSTRLTSGGQSERFFIANDRRSNREINRIRNDSGVNIPTLYNSQQNNSNQRLLTSIVTPTNLQGYLNGSLQDTVSWSGSYDNNALQFGAQLGTQAGQPLDGGIQEIIIFPSDKTPDLTAIHNDINDYYNIY